MIQTRIPNNENDVALEALAANVRIQSEMKSRSVSRRIADGHLELKTDLPEETRSALEFRPKLLFFLSRGWLSKRLL